MLDSLFKLYFVYFQKIGKQGASAAINLLMTPITFNLYLLILFGLSFVINLEDVSTALFTIGLAAVTIVTLLYLRNKYVVEEGYKNIVIKHPVLSILLGIIYFIMSIIIFCIGAYLLISDS